MAKVKVFSTLVLRVINCQNEQIHGRVSFGLLINAKIKFLNQKQYTVESLKSKVFIIRMLSIAN